VKIFRISIFFIFALCALASFYYTPNAYAWGEGISDGLGLSGEAPTVCDYIPDGGSAKSNCKSCLENGNSYTAIGCIDTSSTSNFIKKILTIALGMGGGIAFLLILFGGFQIMTSTGNPEKLQAGQELISGAVAGLMMIMFSVFLLRLIGVDILGLPEWQ